MKAVLLDLMDTIIPDPFFTRLPGMVGSMEEFYAAKSESAFLKFELGIYTEKEYLANFYRPDYEGQKIKIEATRVRDVILDTPPMFEKVQAFLEAARGRIDIHIASNYGEWIHTHLANLEIMPYIGEVFASYQMGVRKPDHRFFTMILDNLRLKTSDVVFIDDQQKNLEAARELGIISYHAEENWHSKLLSRL